MPDTAGHNLLGAALKYAERGRPVFPCGPNKQPLTQHGFQDATTDVEKVRAWWARYPNALIGMPTGRASGVIVLDLDVREGYDGADALAALEDAYGKLPETVEALTPSGGRHLYWRHPDFDVRNSASKLGLGIDVRGDGGYVIVPPSRLPDGRAYEWEASNPPHAAQMPVWALRLLGARVAPKSVSDEHLTRAQAGRRNVHLASIAGRLAHAGLMRDQIRAMVLAENERACDPPVSADEIDRTIMKSATRWTLGGGDKATQSPDEAAGLSWLPASQWIASMSMPEWVVSDVIERGSLNVMIGGWGGGKSVVTLDMACRKTLGLDWQGKPLEAGLVVDVVGEGQRGFQRRIAAWLQQHAPDATLDRLVVIPEAVLVGNADHEAALRLALEEIQAHYNEPVQLVVLDSLARCFGLDDENSNSDVAKWVNSVQQHIVEPTGAAVLALHHPGHGDKKRGRGASALPGAADTEWLIERTANQVQMSCNKNKDGDMAGVYAWRLLGVDVAIGEGSLSVVTVEESEPIDDDDDVDALPKQQRTAYRVLQRLLQEARGNLARQGRSEHEARVAIEWWRDACDIPKPSFRKVRAALSKAGLIHEDGLYVQPLSPGRNEENEPF